jgi:hypothetical protein
MSNVPTTSRGRSRPPGACRSGPPLKGGHCKCRLWPGYWRARGGPAARDDSFGDFDGRYGTAVLPEPGGDSA